MYPLHYKKVAPDRRSHDDQPMAPTVVPPGRQPSASEEVSRPSLQNLIHSASEGGKGRAESVRHLVGDLVSGRLAFLGVGNPRSSSTTSFLPPRSHSGMGLNSNRDPPSNMNSSTLVSVRSSTHRLRRFPPIQSAIKGLCSTGWLNYIDPSIINCVAPATRP